MLKILNDTHLGVKRTAGTTLTSQIMLKRWCLYNFRTELENAEGDDIMILGDLFDDFNVDLESVVDVFLTLTGYVEKWGAKVYVVAGNHDLSKTSTTMSSFTALKGLLVNNKQIVFITEPTATPYGYVIPHLVNQTMFDNALAAVPPTEYLFLHCNYDNGFAAQSDHSLNLSAEVAEELPVKYIVMGHEHATRQIGKVWIPGVQWPTSISDCLAKGETYYSTILTKTGPHFQFSVVVDEDAIYGEVEIFSDTYTPSDRFIRVVGELPKDRVNDAVVWINEVRKNHSAFVISNAVVFVDEQSSFSLEDLGTEIKTFDVLSALKETLTSEETQLLESVC